MTGEESRDRLLEALVPAAGERLQVEVPAVEQAHVPAEVAALEAALESTKEALRAYNNRPFSIEKCNENSNLIVLELALEERIYRLRRRAATGG